ncbi:MAG: hypothetical protein JW731_10315, partial [Bacteroidales bacterium]|nr:hypothetical protein [Bacteroidales bacterium]
MNKLITDIDFNFTMLKIIPLLVFLLIVSFSEAQKADMDSLQQRMEQNISDTARINTLITLARLNLMKKDLSGASAYIDQAFELSKKNNLEIPYGLNWVRADLLHYSRENYAAIEEMDVALKKIEQIGDAQALGKAQNSMAWYYLYAGKFNESIKLFEQNIEFAKSNKLNKVIPEAYSGLAYVYREVKNTEEQRKNLILMIEANRKINDLKFMANGYLRLGDIGMEIDSNFTYAIRQYHECLDIQKQINDSAALSFTLLRI